MSRLSFYVLHHGSHYFSGLDLRKKMFISRVHLDLRSFEISFQICNGQLLTRN